jgi:anaerobic selenocysteine-containing dehydrogenase
METTRSSFCRCCLNRCAIRVTVEDGRATKVTGDRDDPLYGGYTCIKGRSQPQFLYGDDRLLTSLKRLPDGRFAPIPVEQAMDEIAERLLAIRSEHGPRAIAGGHPRWRTGARLGRAI